MNKDISQKAVSSALAGDWNQALELNLQILKEDKSNVDALNRLARAYSELGELNNARKTAKKVLKIDAFNTIAQKSLIKWKGLKKGETIKSKPSSAQTFLEEPGRTKIVSLMHLGDSKILMKIDAGDEVRLNPHSHRISVSTIEGSYIGRLADDLSARLRKLIKLGNEYKAYVKSSSVDEVKVFLRETKRSSQLKDIPSFSTEKIDYISFTPPELVHKKKQFVTTENTEE